MHQRNRIISVRFGLVIVAVLCFTSPEKCRAQNLAKPMANFDPDKITGWWYAWRRTGGLWDSMACARAYFEALGGDNYRITFGWINSGGKPDKQVMELIDDRSIKSKFMFKNDEHTVAMTVLDTDHESYFIVYALLGPKGVYYIGGRGTDVPANILPILDDVIKDNEVELPFFDVVQNNCPTDPNVFLS